MLHLYTDSSPNGFKTTIALAELGLDYRLPIANAILTVENMAQAVARQTDKGRDAARVAVEMVHLVGNAA